MKSGNRNNTKPAGLAAKNSDLRTEIERRAYALWLADERRDGTDISHWLQAERDVLSARQQLPAE